MNAARPGPHGPPGLPRQASPRPAPLDSFTPCYVGSSTPGLLAPTLTRAAHPMPRLPALALARFSSAQSCPLARVGVRPAPLLAARSRPPGCQLHPHSYPLYACTSSSHFPHFLASGFHRKSPGISTHPLLVPLQFLGPHRGVSLSSPYILIAVPFPDPLNTPCFCYS